MKRFFFFLVLTLTQINLCYSQLRDPRSKDQANVFWDGKYDLYSLTSDQKIIPNPNGEYVFWGTTNENPTPYEYKLKKGYTNYVYKFITYNECAEFCNQVRKHKGMPQLNIQNVITSESLTSIGINSSSSQKEQQTFDNNTTLNSNRNCPFDSEVARDYLIQYLVNGLTASDVVIPNTEIKQTICSCYKSGVFDDFKPIEEFDLKGMTENEKPFSLLNKKLKWKEVEMLIRGEEISGQRLHPNFHDDDFAMQGCVELNSQYNNKSNKIFPNSICPMGLIEARYYLIQYLVNGLTASNVVIPKLEQKQTICACYKSGAFDDFIPIEKDELKGISKNEKPFSLFNKELSWEEVEKLMKGEEVSGKKLSANFRDSDFGMQDCVELNIKNIINFQEISKKSNSKTKCPFNEKEARNYLIKFLNDGTTPPGTGYDTISKLEEKETLCECFRSGAFKNFQPLNKEVLLFNKITWDEIVSFIRGKKVDGIEILSNFCDGNFATFSVLECHPGCIEKSNTKSDQQVNTMSSNLDKLSSANDSNISDEKSNDQNNSTNSNQSNNLRKRENIFQETASDNNSKKEKSPFELVSEQNHAQDLLSNDNSSNEFKNNSEQHNNLKTNEVSFKTIQIGSQTWSAENLNNTYFNNGDPIPQAKNREEWLSYAGNKSPAWCYYDFDPSNEKEFGKLYNWWVIVDSRGFLPVDWRIPSSDDWQKLINELATDALIKEPIAWTKLKSTNGWPVWQVGGQKTRYVTCSNCKNWNDEYRKKVPCHVCKDERSISVIVNEPIENKNGNGTNSSGFNAKPGGAIDDKGYFQGKGDIAFFWRKVYDSRSYIPSSYYSIEAKLLGVINFSYMDIIQAENDWYEARGFSIRCVKD